MTDLRLRNENFSEHFEVTTQADSPSDSPINHALIAMAQDVIWNNRIFLAIVSAVVFTLPHLLNPEAIAGGWLTVFSNYFLVPSAYTSPTTSSASSRSTQPEVP
jgi:hypothetical protein